MLVYGYTQYPYSYGRVCISLRCTLERDMLRCAYTVLPGIRGSMVYTLCMIYGGEGGILLISPILTYPKYEV